MEENKAATISRLYGDVTTFQSQLFQLRMKTTPEDFKYWREKLHDTWTKMVENMALLMEG